MVCKMAKRGVLITAAVAGGLALLFGSHAPSVVRTAFHKVRNSAHAAVPPQFEIDLARQQVTELEPAIHRNIEEIARAEVEIESLSSEIQTTQLNLDKQAQEMVALRKHLDSGDLKLTGGKSYSTEEVRADLARRFDHYRTVKGILADKENTLKLREKALDAARQQNGEIRAQKVALLTKIEGIETRLKQIEATQAANEFNFDDSALARAKQTVNELQKKVEVMARVAEQEGRYAGQSVPIQLEPNRDILKEFDAEFAKPADLTTSGKEL